MIGRAARWLLGTVGALAVLLALSVVAVRLLLLEVPERRTELQQWVNRTTGLDLRMSKLTARWSSGGPQIYATDVEVYAPFGGPRLARAKAVSIGTDLKHMLLRRELLFGHVRLIGPQVRLVRTAEGLRLEGQPGFRDRPESERLNADALPSGSLEIVDGVVTLLDEQGEQLISIRGVRLDVQRDGDVLQLAGDLNLPRTFGHELAFSGAARGRLDRPETLRWTVRLAGEQLHLDQWGQFLDGRWRELNPRGELHSIKLALSGNGRQSPRFELAARFTGLGVDPVDRIPGLSGLAGELQTSEREGQAHLVSPGLELSMPYRFREALPAEVNGFIRWTREEASGNSAQWRIHTEGLQVVSPHARAVADVDLTIPTDGSARYLKLQARVQDAVLKEAWRYFPIDRLRNPKTLAWLDGAFLSGRAPTAEVVFDGPLNKFPFREGEGQFRVRGTVEALNLHYGEGWPDLTQLTGDVEFRNQGMEAKVHGGSVQGMRIAAGSTAHIADFKLAEVSVRGRASGDLSAALAYLRASPLGPRLGAQFTSLRGFGPVNTELDLWLPVREREKRRFTVTAQLGGDLGANRLVLPDTDHELRDVRGTLHIKNKQLTGQGLRASYLGGPVTIDLKPQTDARTGATEHTVFVQAQTPASALGQLLKVPEKIPVSGMVPWRATGRIAGSPQTLASAQVESDLLGVAIPLPVPLQKGIGESRFLRIDMRRLRPDAMRVQLAYGASMRAELNFASKAQPESVPMEPGALRPPPGSGTSWRLSRGAVHIGPGVVAEMPANGLAVTGEVDALDLSGWLALRSAGTGERRLSDVLRSIDLNIGELWLYGFRLPEVAASLLAGAQAWSVKVSGPRSRGTLLVPFTLSGSDPVRVDMAHLDLGEPQGIPGVRRQDPDPARWPAVKISIRQFAAWNKQFGYLRAELAPAPAGLSLKSVSARAPSFKLDGSGSWLVADDGLRSRLALKLESTDVLHTLQSLGYGGSLTGERGLAVLDLQWPGAPDAGLIGRLSGTVSVEVDRGQLVGVQPGAGRVFGLMSVATLRRRLALDFSDLTDKGLSFDAIRGDFTLDGGNAYTSNLLLRGPAAEIGVIGRTGLNARDYDQTAVVTGSFGQSLPVAGALAGGPAVGAALLVFSQIFKQPLKGIARGYYRITGPWDDPIIERVEAEEVKKAAEAVRAREQQAGAS